MFNPKTVRIEYYEDNKVKTVVEESVNAQNDTYVYLYVYNSDGNLNEMTYTCTSGSTGKSSGYSYFYTYEKNASGEILTCIKESEGLSTDEKVEYAYDYADGNITKIYKDGRQILGFEYVFIENPSTWARICSEVNPSQVGALCKTAATSVVY